MSACSVADVTGVRAMRSRLRCSSRARHPMQVADRSFKRFGGCGEVVIAHGPLPSLACVEPRSQYIRDALSGVCEGALKRPVTHRHILIVYPVFKNHGQNCDAGARTPGTYLPDILRLHQTDMPRDTPLTGANAYSASCADSSVASSIAFSAEASSARLRATRAATSSSART